MADTTVGFQFDAALGLASAGPRDDESSVLAGLRSGNEAAYEALIRQYEHPIFSLVSRLVEDAGDAPDVVQEVFVKVFRKVGSFRGESSLKTWIYRIAVNEARNQRRWFGRHRRRELCLDPLPGVAPGFVDRLEDPGRSPYEETLDRENRALIEEALQEISPAFRAALVLREIEGLSYDEIAEILEISLGTVKSRILRGREALRKSLTAKLEAAPAAGFPCRRRIEEAVEYDAGF